MPAANGSPDQARWSDAVGGILLQQHDRIAELPLLNPGVIALLGRLSGDQGSVQHADGAL